MLTYVVASKFYMNRFISKKCETSQSFKIHFLQNTHFAQLYTSASDCKGVGNIPGNQFVKSFSALLSHSL